MKVSTMYKTISFYCLKCRKNTESKNPEIVKTKNGRIMLLSKCTLCHSKKPKVLKKQEAIRLLSNLTRVKILILSDLPILNYI